MSFTPLQLTHKVAQRYELDIIDCDLAIVNGIRRTILTDIPNLGFQGEDDPTITIHKNTTPLHNEFMSHRISLIPIHFSEEEVENFQEDEYIFECSLKNNSPNMVPLTTRHLTGKRNNQPLTEKELHRLFPLHPITNDPVLITRLRQGEELSFTAKVIKSTAGQHAAFSPVSLCTLYYNPVENSQHTGLEKERDYQKNNYGDPSSIHFLIESECGLTPKYLITKALEILLQKVDNLYSYLPNVKAADIPNTLELTIPNENDTIGNLLQSLLFNKYIREQNKILNKYTVTFVGYLAPHPLEKIVTLKMTLQNEALTPSQEEYVQALQEGLRYVEAELKNTYNAWLNSQA